MVRALYDEGLMLASLAVAHERIRELERLARGYLTALEDVRAKQGSPFLVWRAAEDALEGEERALREALAPARGA